MGRGFTDKSAELQNMPQMKPISLISQTTSTKLLIMAIIFLVIAKLFPLFHIQFDSTTQVIKNYLDVDRVLALSFLLWVFFKYFDSWESRPTLFLALAFLPAIYLANIEFLSFERLLHLYLLTALVEEILFRGVLFYLLMQRFSGAFTVVSTSIVFTLLHPQIYHDLSYAIAVLLTGLLIGTVYVLALKQSRQMAIAVVTVLHFYLIIGAYYIGLLT